MQAIPANKMSNTNSVLLVGESRVALSICSETARLSLMPRGLPFSGAEQHTHTHIKPPSSELCVQIFDCVCICESLLYIRRFASCALFHLRKVENASN